jgi:imidazolonepropionase-like amidohydrolase
VAMLAVLATVAAVAGPSDTLRYAVTIQGNPAGSSLVVRESATTTRIWFEFNDRGRGPKTETVLETTRAGLPRRIVVTGNNYFKQKVDERFSAAGGQAAWSSAGERGTASARRSFYLPRESAPEILGTLARALLRTPGHTLAVLPAGTARATSLTTLTVRRPDRSAEVTLVAIDGPGFEADHLWLDRDSTLFAIVGGWQRTYQLGWEGALDLLQKTQDSTTAAQGQAAATRLTDRPTGPVAFMDVTIFDATAARLIPEQTVLVEGTEIKAVGPSATMRLASTVRLIPARGKVLLPGLWDMHGHLSEVDGRLNIAAGVTSVRDMANDVDFLLATRKAFDAGTAIGPRVVMAGFIDGPGPYAGPTKALVSTPEQAIEWVDRYASLGYEQIKLYSSLDPALVPIIAERAHAKGMRLSGHIPRGMIAADAVRAGYDEIQHTNMLFLNFLGDTLDTRTPVRFTAVAKAAADLDLASAPVREFLDLLAAKGTVVDPTVATFEEMFTADPAQMTPGNATIAHRLPPQVSRGLRGGGLPADPATRIRYRASYAKMLAMVKALYDRGIPIVAGTDCLAGMCLHRELELYVQAGIPASAVLKIATLGAATVAKRADRLGTIEPGKLADLVLIAGNPVARIGDIRKVDLVMKDGLLYDPAKIQASLGILRWNAAGGRRQ